MWEPTRLVINVRQQPCASGLLGALMGCLAWFRDERDQAEVAGLTGWAFRLHVDETVSPASLAAFPWREEIAGMLARLGYDHSIVAADDTDPRLEQARGRAAEQAAAGIAKARPSLVWGAQLPEFGVVRGFDRQARTLHVSGVLDGKGGVEELPYERLGRGEIPAVFVCTLDDREDVDPAAATRAALRWAAACAQGLTPRAGGTAAGPAAWTAWREALATGRIDPVGHAMVAAVAAEARAAAPVWLRRCAHGSPATAGRGGLYHAAVTEAAAAYQAVADALAELSASWPFPLPDGALLTTPLRRHHEDLLAAAAAAEARGAAALARAADLDRRAAAGDGLTIGPAAELFTCIQDLPLAGLASEAAELRAAPHPALLTQAARDASGAVVGHVYYAPLASSGAGVVTDDPGSYLYIYCMWVAQDRRRAGLGRRLLDAVVADAKGRGCDGILVEATGRAIFLHHEGYAALGFTEVDQQNDDARLLYLPLTQAPCRARLWEPSPQPRGHGSLRVLVSAGRPCPLLLRNQRNIAAAARELSAAGLPVAVEETPSPPHGVTVAGMRLPLGYVPQDTARRALQAAAEEWNP